MGRATVYIAKEERGVRVGRGEEEAGGGRGRVSPKREVGGEQGHTHLPLPLPPPPSPAPASLGPATTAPNGARRL
ncbi:hypothetical protein PPACK8108_LOCUS18569 [Phakopsora pachyrhizi]|uniref:Uncharacterized protein n=1 Tax=Phakopsora pachyrhizi TaxID=170000 RepID=A0AAV0BF41_PHAPC|nr:hypothetical protein PPACK8108_LOCUS18569 [Phakopsora pachyrhizi]